MAAATGACKVVCKGGVGESGATSLVQHKVTGQNKIVMVIRNTKTSLCGNTGAIAILVVNGVTKAHGVITTAKSSIQVNAKPGDVVIGIVHAIPLFNEIVCVRLGELNFTLEQCELV
jgi:hypothetical protein